MGHASAFSSNCLWCPQVVTLFQKTKPFKMLINDEADDNSDDLSTCNGSDDDMSVVKTTTAA